MFCDTGKICYDTSREASTAAANLDRHDKKNKYSFYKCPHGNHWHTNTIKKNRKSMPKKINKYPIKYTWPPVEEKNFKKKKKK